MRSHLVSDGISISSYENIALGKPPAIIDNTIAEQVSSYRHTIKANGGYWELSFSLAANSDTIDDWINNGPGRHIQVKDGAGNTVWRGFVNNVDARIGSKTNTVALFPDIANRIQVRYQTIDWSTGQAITGVPKLTSIANNLDSQARFGIIERTISTDGSTSARAESDRDRWLSTKAFPIPGGKTQLGDSSTAQASVTCWGYIRWLENYFPVLAKTASTGYIKVSDKIKNILSAQLTDIISTDFSRIQDSDSFTTDTPEINEVETGKKSAFQLIMRDANQVGLVETSGETGVRTTFGVYEDEQAIYQVIPDDIAYEQSETDPAQSVFIYGGGPRVPPWLALPGRWVLKLDTSTGQIRPDDKRRDTKLIFAETVTVSQTPTGLYKAAFDGPDTKTTNQAMARKGLAGVQDGN